MALTSVFYDGPVTETDRAKNRGGVADYGVNGIGDFKVTAHPSIPYAVLVKAGRAHGHGVTDTAEIDQPVQCATLASGTRWDLITVRRNWQPALGGPSTLEALQAGETAAIPAARKVGPGVEDDQPLALVQWTGGLSAPQQIIDLRVWASNGGLYAKDDLVRTYLTGVGTEVNINGTLWALQIGASDTLVWVKSSEIGKIPLVGFLNGLTGTPAAGQGFLMQAGSTVQVSDASGYARITWPTPFPNGLLTVIAFDGDDWTHGGSLQFASSGRVDVWGSEGGGNRTSWVYAVKSQPASPNGDMSGNKLILSRNGGVNKLHRINWIAIGW